MVNKICKICKTKFHSWSAGSLPKGCRLCVQGKKLVLFVTGLCSGRCFYCPISEKKKDKDVIYANEWPIENEKDIIAEARLCRSEGAGITGGDPLVRLKRTLKFIRMLKREFGKGFHIHMYVPLGLVSRKILQQCYRAGLDEIRVHPQIGSDKYWKKIRMFKEFDWDVGVEIPVIPGMKKDSVRLIDFIRGNIDFLNLNELEISEINLAEFISRGLVCKDRQSYAIKGSHELAMQLIEYAAKKGISTHYCTAKLKDRVQLANRILRRAKSTALPTDIITPDGTLFRGAVYLPETIPSFSYQKTITRKNPSALKELKRILPGLKRLFKSKLTIDSNRLRILTSARELSKSGAKIKRQGLVPALVEEYPTFDALLVDVRFI